jgi:CDGSH-type Zn-finger protein
MSERRGRIDVTPHGPYEVSGDVPLRRKTIVRTPDGDPVTWRTGDEIDHPATYYLCRCGGSANKPFCDGTHAFELFDGVEAPAEHDSTTEVHRGPTITVIKDGARCHQAHFCVNRITNWFEMTPRSGDTQVLTQLVAMIEHCPSGALSYELDGEPIEPDIAAGIGAVDDGPLFVTGHVEVVRTDGSPLPDRNRTSLCRCGQSRNKPLCDGSHVAAGFEA